MSLALIFGLVISDPTPNLSLSLTVKSLSRALAAWFPNPTVRARSTGGLKRGTVVSRTDYVNLYIRYKIGLPNLKDSLGRSYPQLAPTGFELVH